jgi:hypothetical protein
MNRECRASPVLISPDNPMLRLLAGRPQTALDMFQRIPDGTWRLMGVAVAEHDLGHAAESLRALDAMKARYAHSFPYQIALVHAWRGERDLAFEWLEKAYAQRDAGLSSLKSSVLLRKLRQDQRYTALLRKMNLPPD